MDNYYIGVDWGGTRVKLGAVSADGELIHREALASDGEASTAKTVDRIIETVAAIVGRLDGTARGIGIGLTGPVDPGFGVVYLPGKVIGLDGYPVVERFQDAFRLPVRAENDGKLALFAEMARGHARNVQWAVVLTIGTGVGSGVLIDGKVIDDPRFLFGTQVGHLVINAAHRERCLTRARGTAEQLCSATALVMTVQSALRRGLPSVLGDFYRSDPRSIDFRTIIEKGVECGDEVCLDAWQNWKENLGWLVVNAVTAYSPEVVILSGGACAAADLFIEDLRRHVNEHAFRSGFVGNCPIKVTEMAEYAGVIGAAAMISQRTQND